MTTKSDSVSSGLVDELADLVVNWRDGGLFDGRDVWEIASDAHDEIERLDALSVAQAEYISFLAVIVSDHETLQWARTSRMSSLEKVAEGKRLRAAIYAAGGKIPTATDDPSANPSKGSVPYISPDEMQGDEQ